MASGTEVVEQQSTSGPDNSCQFAGTIEVLEYNGRCYCQAHAPLGAPGRFQASQLQSFVANRLKNGSTIDLTSVVFPTYEQRYPLNGGTVIARRCTFQGGVALIAATLDISGSRCLGNLSVHCTGGDLIASQVHFAGDVNVYCGSAGRLDFTDSKADGEFVLDNVVMSTPELRFDGMSLAFALVMNFNIAPGTGMPQNSSFRRLRLRRSAFGNGAEGRYRTIRNRLHQNRDREQEGTFYQYEKRAKRKGLSLRRAASWIPRFVSACYDWLAGYGQSFERVLMWFIGLQVGFGFLYAVMSKRFAWDGDTFDSQVAAFTLAQIVKPFELLSARKPIGWPYAGVYTDGSGWWIFATAVHSVLSLILVALFLLALRWRFRRD
jgi:hypothetical protein